MKQLKIERKSWPRIIQVFSILLFVGATIFALLVILPFAPYKQLSFAVTPDEVCPGGDVRIEVIREVNIPFLARDTQVNVKSWWEDANSGGKIGSGEVEAPLIEGGPEQVESLVIRIAPTTPGEYWLGSETTASAYYGFVPRYQKITNYSYHTTKVRSDCEGGK